MELEKFIFNEDHAKLYFPQNGNDYAIVCTDARPCVSTYTFTASSADRYDRFVLVFGNTYNANGSDADIFAYQNGSDIIVEGEGTLEIYDVMGRLIAKQYVNGVRTHCVCPSGTGVYILKLEGKTQKIIIK